MTYTVIEFSKPKQTQSANLTKAGGNRNQYLPDFGIGSPLCTQWLVSRKPHAMLPQTR